MKTVEGYVFIAKNGDSFPMYGPDKNCEGQRFENIETNGLIPYDSIVNTVIGVGSYRIKMNPNNLVELAKLEMQIAENMSEAEKEFKNESSLIVVCKDKMENYFLTGVLREGKASSYPAERLMFNGYQTFNNGGNFSAFQNSFEATEQICRQAQGDISANIAKFNLNKLGTFPPLQSYPINHRSKQNS